MWFSLHKTYTPELPSERPSNACGQGMSETHLSAIRLELGFWYEPVELPKTMAIGTPEQCHTNAVNLALDDDSLIYCEGYALFQETSFPVIHAWVTDGHGNAIDNTWPQPGVAYAGVPFKSLFVNMTALKNHAIVSLLDVTRITIRCEVTWEINPMNG